MSLCLSVSINFVSTLASSKNRIQLIVVVSCCVWQRFIIIIFYQQCISWSWINHTPTRNIFTSNYRDKLEEDKEFDIVGDISEVKATAEATNGVEQNGEKEQNKEDEGNW